MFAILRTKKISDYTKASQAFKHNLRQNYRGNVDQERSHLNTVYVDQVTSSEGLRDFYEGLGVQERANSVKAMEFVFTASPEFFEHATPEQFEAWKRAQVAFAKREWGEKLRFLVCHEDESSPHFHAIVTVEEKKTHRYKNQKGEFFKEKTSLNARRFDPEYLKDLQTRYAKTNSEFGLHRGLRGSKAKHKAIKQYQKEVANALNGDYSDDLSKAFDKEFLNKKRLGFISFDDAKAFYIHAMNKALRRNKKLKTALNLSKDYYKNSQIILKRLKTIKDMTKMQEDFIKTIQENKDLIEENKYLKQSVELLKVQLQRTELPATDKKIIGIVDKMKNKR